MTNIKTLMLAAATVLSLGAGTAMAQDLAFFLEQDQALGVSRTHQVAPVMPVTSQPQAGSSDVDQQFRTQPYVPQVLQGADGNGG